ncbi:hypothetical protein ABH931_004352 [Streptacidiphilus sp. MAP12-33]|uniref:alkaline phosphatase family protein n=1 Tax=Streptacidiphilus sp. MAP12-33 TaxID=3156266 RepID=UPI003517BCAE
MPAAKARTWSLAALCATGAVVAGLLQAPQASAHGPAQAPHAPGAPHYDHVFVVVEENHGYTDVIGNPAAPNLNALAATYGSATNYSAVTHPSEPNYVAMLGGSTFGVQDDNPYYVNSVGAPSLITELDRAHVGWKAYLQDLPHPGYQGICYPANCNGSPDKDPLYVSKHNGITNFTSSWNAADRAGQVPLDQLTRDLSSGHVPAFGYVIPSECQDQHGDPPFCIDSGTTGGSDPQDQRLVAQGDAELGSLVAQITGASFWARGNNAIDIVYDEGDDNGGAGGGRTVDVVVTSHGPRHVQDPTAYSHYSLLRTLQDDFGVACLQHSCDASTAAMAPLFAVAGAGSPAQAFRSRPVPAYATPSPLPTEPVTMTTDTASGGGWTEQPAPMLGTTDNSFGAVAAVSPTDVWAVGNFMPDTSGSNQDATLNKAAHFDGSRWTSTPIGDVGPNFDTLFGVAAVPGHAWAVGVATDGHYRTHSLVQSWDGRAWQPVTLPTLGSVHDTLYAATAVSAHDVWAVGDRENADGSFGTLVEHDDGRGWSVVRVPDPGSTGDHLYGVTARGADDVWAVGQRDGASGDTPLVEHYDGHRWSAVDVPAAGTTGALLQGVALGAGGQVWAVGQSDDARHRARPLVVHFDGRGWSARQPAGLGSGFSNVTGVAVSQGVPYLVGSWYDAASGNQTPLVAALGADGTWRSVGAPDPGAGDTVLGGVAAAPDGELWAVGFANGANGRIPLVEHHC